MSLSQARPSMAVMTRSVERKPEHHAEFSDHVESFLARLQSSWPNTENCVWDEQVDTIAYGRQVVRLTRDQVREVYYRLRERHTFRPSVAEVRTVVDELLTQANPTHKLTGAEIKMRTVHTMPRALPSAANGPHREAARREIARRRAQANLVPVAERKAENQAPQSAPVSWVGMLVVALVDGKDVRGVVWSEEGDTLTIKAGAGHKFTLGKAFVRVEVVAQ